MSSRSAEAEHLNDLNTLFNLGTVGGLADWQLLDRFTSQRDEDAFAVLVGRHGPMVLRVCRGVLASPHDAQDAFQATFLILARRAASIRRRDSISSWLFGVARRVAKRIKADAARWRDRNLLRTAASPAGDANDYLGWAELHEEIARLPDRFKNPVLLCYLEGLSTEAAAQRLGCPKGTVLSRLSRGRERLKKALTRRGVGPAAVFSTVLSLETTRAEVPGGLATETVCVSMQFVSGEGAAVGTASRLMELTAEKVLRTMFMTNLKFATVAILTAGILTFGLAGLASRGKAAVAPLPQAEAPREVLPIEQAKDQPKEQAKDQPKEQAKDGALMPFQQMGIDADDLVQATGLNIYKFRFDMPKGHKFRVVLREFKDADSGPRNLHTYKFEKREEGPTSLRFDFLRRDNALQGVLLSNEKEAQYRIDSPGCTPTGIVTIIRLPLAELEATKKSLLWHRSNKDNEMYGLKETRLLTVLASEPGKPAPLATAFPRMELVIVDDK